MANPSIPLQVQPIRLPDVLESYGKAISLRQLLGQERMQGLQTQQAERAIQRQAKRDELAQRSGGNLSTLRDLLSQEGYFEEASQIDERLSGRAKAEREAQSAGIKLTKDQWELTGQLAGAVVNADPQDRPGIWGQALNIARSANLPDAANLPDQWDERLLPQLQSLMTRAMSAKDVAERVDYRDLGAQGAQQAPQTMQDYLGGPVVRRLDMSTPEGVPIGQDELPAGEAAFQEQLQATGQARVPDEVGITGPRPRVTPDDYRMEASRLEAMGTKAAYERAKDYRAEAERLDNRIFKERGKDTALDAKVRALVESGVPERIAKGIASGRYTVSVNPINGQREVIDIASGQRVGRGDENIVPPDDGTAMPEGVEGPEATGGSGFFSNIANRVKDSFGLGLANPKAEEARNALQNLGIQTITLMQDAVPGRPSVFLLEQLQKLTVNPGSLLQGDAAARLRLKQTRDMLSTEISRMGRDILSKSGQFKPEQVTVTRLNHSKMHQLLKEYDQILNSFDAKFKNRRPLKDFVQ